MLQISLLKKKKKVNFHSFHGRHLILCAKKLVLATFTTLDIDKCISCTKRLHIIDKMDKAFMITSSERITDKE